MVYPVRHRMMRCWCSAGTLSQLYVRAAWCHIIGQLTSTNGLEVWCVTYTWCCLHVVTCNAATLLKDNTISLIKLINLLGALIILYISNTMKVENESREKTPSLHATSLFLTYQTTSHVQVVSIVIQHSFTVYYICSSLVFVMVSSFGYFVVAILDHLLPDFSSCNSWSNLV